MPRVITPACQAAHENNNLDKTRLKPCPFCGTTDRLKVGEESGFIRIYCDGEDCQEAYWDSLDDAMNQWNVRDGVYDTREVA